MEQRLEQLRKENNEEAMEYFDFIKSSVNDGSYFRDGMNWYFFRYISPICDRTILIFGAITAAIVLFFLFQMVKSAFPLVQKVPIFIAAKDQTNFYPLILPLKNRFGKDSKIIKVDEIVAKYLIQNYVKDRESYDFSKGEIDDVNIKFTRIRNTSSASEYQAFQAIMSKENPDSPINNFGQNVKNRVEIESVSLVKEEPKDFKAKAKEFLSKKISNEAEVKFTVITTTFSNEGTKAQKERYLAKINFDFEGIDRDDKGDISFVVRGYKLYKIK